MTRFWKITLPAETNMTKNDMMRLSATTRDEVLTKADFRKAVFERDEHMCVLCDRGPPLVAHVIDQTKFRTIDNGVALCTQHAGEAAEGVPTPDELRDILESFEGARHGGQR